MPSQFPIIVGLANTLAQNGLVGIPAFSEIHVTQVDGYLRGLPTLGTHQIRVRDPIDGTVIQEMSWNAGSARLQRFEGLDIIIPDGHGLIFDCLSLGVGALDCTVTVWCLVF